MGKKDLKLLKKTLKEIYNKNEDIAILEKRKKINSKELAKSKKLIEKLESSNQAQQLDLNDFRNISVDSSSIEFLTVNQLKDILRENGLPVSGNKKKLMKRIIDYSRTSGAVKTTSSWTLDELRENVKTVRKTVQLDEKKRELKRHPVHVNSNESMVGWWIVAIIILALGMVLYQTQLDSYLDSGFDCGNGETIHGSLVLNGEDDCSNGHDEKDPFWSTSDAQSYQADEPLPWIGCCGFLIILGIGFASVDADNESARKMNSKKKAELNDKVADAERKVMDANLLLRKAERKQDQIKKNNEDLKKLTNNIDRMEKYKETVSIEIKEIQQQRDNLYENIKHLIPYSDIL